MGWHWGSSGTPWRGRGRAPLLAHVLSGSTDTRLLSSSDVCSGGGERRRQHVCGTWGETSSLKSASFPGDSHICASRAPAGASVQDTRCDLGPELWFWGDPEKGLWGGRGPAPTVAPPFRLPTATSLSLLSLQCRANPFCPSPVPTLHSSVSLAFLKGEPGAHLCVVVRM